MELSGNFTRLSFGEAMQKARSLVQRYYSCYPLLLQICVLYMNHFMLAEKEEEQRQILKEAEELCDRIREYCTDVGICGDAITLKAVLNLQLGNAAEVIEMMEPVGDPTRISGQNEAVLIQAYQMAGETEKAKDYIQIRQYLHLLTLIENAAGFLLLYGDDLEKCEETIKRTEKILEVYRVNSLHPNQAAQFYYQAAVVYAANAKKEKALEELEHFKKCVSALLNCEKMLLHGDDYFDRLDIWIESLPLGDSAPREKVFARQNALQALSHPAFSSLQDSEEFQKIYHYFQKEA